MKGINFMFLRDINTVNGGRLIGRIHVEDVDNRKEDLADIYESMPFKKGTVGQWELKFREKAKAKGFTNEEIENFLNTTDSNYKDSSDVVVQESSISHADVKQASGLHGNCDYSYSGNTVSFSNVPDPAKLKTWLKARGAKIVNDSKDGGTIFNAGRGWVVIEEEDKDGTYYDVKNIRTGEFLSSFDSEAEAISHAKDEAKTSDSKDEKDIYTKDPLTEKGKEIISAMKEQYGEKAGESVFYASKNKGVIEGVD